MECPKCGTTYFYDSDLCKICKKGDSPNQKQPSQTTISNLVEDNIEYYIDSPPLPPKLLTKDKAITIGRNESNDIVLSFFEISRHHCVIKWRNSAYYLIDNNSANGILVNDETVIEHKLSPGDKIGIGPAILIFKEKEVDLAPAPEETMRLRKDARTVNAKSAFSGDMKDIALYQVLQILAAEEKTGEVKIFYYNRKIGSIFFQCGRVIHSVHKTLSGYEAFLQIFQMTEGRYEFDSSKMPEETTMNNDVEGLFLECARIMDEAGR